ncbi:dihydrofolate reductase family protein [Actinocorallia libanotica]|uniref:Dihydrofolate reductase family protein n=1 Tax=Actinocorallia libanotica TaxID=46162 RepID=A0ABN1QPY8_9ACTN
MNRIFSFHVVSVDGYYQGPEGEFDWPNTDEGFLEFSVAQLKEIDTLVFGRRTYEHMAAYWPTSEALESDPVIAGLMNSYAKIVVSHTLAEPRWHNTEVITDPALLRARRGTLAVFGSSELTTSLLAAGLIDELRVMVHPVVLGAGRPLFHTADRRHSLTLTQSRTFTTGNVLLTYRPAGR